jgi:hypothetical protein
MANINTHFDVAVIDEIQVGTLADVGLMRKHVLQLGLGYRRPTGCDMCWDTNDSGLWSVYSKWAAGFAAS